MTEQEVYDTINAYMMETHDSSDQIQGRPSFMVLAAIENEDNIMTASVIIDPELTPEVTRKEALQLPMAQQLVMMFRQHMQKPLTDVSEAIVMLQALMKRMDIDEIITLLEKGDDLSPNLVQQLTTSSKKAKH